MSRSFLDDHLPPRPSLALAAGRPCRVLTRRKMLSNLSACELLRSCSRSQKSYSSCGLLSAVAHTGLWIPCVAGAFGLFSGSRRHARRLIQHGAPWVLRFEILDDSSVHQDLLSVSVRSWLFELISLQAVCG